MASRFCRFWTTIAACLWPKIFGCRYRAGTTNLAECSFGLKHRCWKCQRQICWIGWVVHPNYSSYIEKRLGPTFALIKGDVAEFDKLLQLLISQSSDSKRKVQPLYFDYNTLQSGTVKPVEADQLQVKEGFGNPYLLYRLGQFADLVDWQPENQSAEFRLTAESGKRAQNISLNYEQVRRFLVSVTGVFNRLSPSMELRLKGWLRILRCGTAERRKGSNAAR